MTHQQTTRDPARISAAWQPSLVLIERDVKDHPETLRILERCSGASVRFVSRRKDQSDHELLRDVIGEDSLEKLGRLARRSLLLLGDSNISQQMAAGPVNERRCYNFTKITPYIGVCRANCGYCWFKDPVLIPKVNVLFFDYLPDLMATFHANQGSPVVFTFTHYKTDCFAIEHLTGFARKIAKVFEGSRFYIQFLTKLHTVEALLEHTPGRNTMVTFSVNAPRISRLVEIGASQLLQRLNAGRLLTEAGIPVLLRIDPVWAIGDWRNDYSRLATLISERFNPQQITIGTPRFQSLDELHRVINLIEEPNAHAILKNEASRMADSKPGLPEADGRPHYFSNLTVSYTFEERRLLYRHIVDVLGRALPGVPMGLCEEPESMWAACSLPWHADPTVDCSCNFIPKKVNV